MPWENVYSPGHGTVSSLRFQKNYVCQAPIRLFKTLFQKESQKMANQLADIAKTSKTNLSSDTRIQQLTLQLEERLQQFQQDLEKGCFAVSN